MNYKKILIISIFSLFLVGVSLFYVYSFPSETVIVTSNLQKGLIAHFTLDEVDYNPSTNRVSDLTPYSNHGTNYNATFTTDRFDREGGAMEFSGNRIHTGITSTPDNMTFSVWFKKTTSSWDSIAILGKRNSTTGWMLYRNANDSNGYFRWYMHYRRTNDSITAYNAWPGISGLQVGEWYNIVVTRDEDGYSRIYVNGNLASNSSPPADFKDWVYNTNGISIGSEREGSSSWSSSGAKMDDVRIYNRILSLEEIKQLHDLYKPKIVLGLQKGLVLDIPLTSFDYNSSTGIISDRTPYLNAVENTEVTFNENNEASFSQNTENLLLDYKLWKDGQTGSVSGFNRNGSDLENFRVISKDPWGRDVVVWEARPDAVSGADGGWNSSTFSIDNSKMYRFSVWVKRNNNVNGRFYIGTNGYGSTNGVLRRNTGANNTNPYFWTNITFFQPNVWYLVVGHVWPVNSGTGSNYSDSGIYTVENGRVGNISLDYVWRGETTSARHRSYLYYATDTSQRQWFAYPRVDIIDGTEPTIEELLNGHDYYGSDMAIELQEDLVTISFWYKENSQDDWTHVVNSSGNYYVNGEEASPEYYPVVIDNNYIYIGRTSMSDYFNGNISSLRIYNHALSFDEIELLYARGK